MGTEVDLGAGFLTLAELAAGTVDGGDDTERPTADDIAELRHYLGHELAAITADWGDRPDADLRVTKRRLQAMALCPARVLAELDDAPLTPALAVGVICDIAAGVLSVNPRFPAEGGWLTSLRGAIGYERPEVLDYLDTLDADELDELAATVDERCAGLPYLLGDLSPLRPTSHERVAVRFVEAGVHLAAEIDLAAGLPRVLAEVKSGSYNNWIPEELRHYGLLVALRDGVAPKVGAAVTLTDQKVSAVSLGLAELELAAKRVAVTARGLVEVDVAVSKGESVPTRPDAHCRWCSRLTVCPDASDLARAEHEADR